MPLEDFIITILLLCSG